MQRARTWMRRWAEVALAALAAASCSSDPAVSVSLANPPVCAAPAGAIVQQDGTEVYQEAGSVLTVEGELVLVGAPTYGNLPQPADRDAIQTFRHAYVATYLSEPPRLVAKPIEGHVQYAIGASLGGPRWGTIMAEGPDTMGTRSRALWYGEYDGSRWLTLERMPLPPDAVPDIVGGSDLVRADDRIAWAATDYSVSSSVFIYERTNGAWRIDRLDFDVPVESARVAYDQQSRLWLLVVGVEGEPDAPWDKTLRLFRRAADWELVHRLAVYEGAAVEVMWAKLSVAASGLTASWILGDDSGLDAVTRTGITDSSAGAEYVLDRGAENVYAAAVPDGSVAWLIDYVGPSPDLDPVARRHELKLMRIVDGQPRVVASARSPFVGTLRIHPLGVDDILVVGPQMGLVRPQVPVRSLILRLSASC